MVVGEIPIQVIAYTPHETAANNQSPGDRFTRALNISRSELRAYLDSIRLNSEVSNFYRFLSNKYQSQSASLKIETR